LPAPSDSPSAASSREKLRDRFQSVRAFSHELTDPLSPEDQTIQSMTDASPAKWHLAHTSWFFETFVLKQYVPDYRPHNDMYEYMFNSYYQGIGPQYNRSQRGIISRPTVAQVGEYRAHVDGAMGAYFEEASDNAWEEAASLIELGLNHEQQHQELLLTDIKHAMSFNPLMPAVYQPKVPVADSNGAPELEWIEYPGGIQSLGWDGEGFAFDNEGPVHDVLLQPYGLASRLVTNGEYMEFMEAGGYQSPRHWHADGWTVVETQGWSAPIYWRQDGGIWYEYTLRGLEPLDPDGPLTHISFYEASAYADWRGCRLPTEAEWEVAARDEPIRGNFVDTGLYHSTQFGGASDGDGNLRQIYGDVWEWTSSPYTPYPGFKPAEGAVGEYNGKFMANQMVLRGGSCATAHDHIRSSYRNFFYPDARWQFTGIRLAKDFAGNRRT